MLTLRAVLGLLRPERLREILSLLLLWALVPFGETVLVVIAGEAIGPWLVLAVTAASTLAGVLAVASRIRREVAEIARRAEANEPPGTELAEIAGLLVGALLFLSPGLVTDLAALVVCSRRLRRRAGAAVLGRLGIDARRIHEYLKLTDAAAAARP